MPLLQMFIASESHGLIFKNVLTLRFRLATKHAPLQVSTDLPSRQKINLGILLKS